MAVPAGNPRPLSPRETNPQFGGNDVEASSAAPGTESHLLSPIGLQRRRCPTCSEHYPGNFLHCPRDATKLVEASAQDTDPLVGCVLGDTYQVIRVIGEGGMGRVYEARHLRLTSSLGVVRVARGSAPLTSAEIAFAGLASLGLLVAPSIIWTWFLAKHVWSSTPRVMDVLDRIRHVLGASLGTYAGLTLLIRILASTLHIDPSGIAWPGWGVLSFLVAALIGGAAARSTLKARSLAD